MEITKQTTYKEVKEWFMERLKMYKLGDETVLPITLDAKFKYYCNVPFTVEVYINQIDKEFERVGASNIKKSAIAVSAKNNLFAMFNDLKNKSKWNAPRPTLDQLQSKWIDDRDKS